MPELYRIGGGQVKPTPIIDIAATRLPGGTPTPTGKRIPAWQRDCENLWVSYSAKRDKIVHWHQRCLASGERSPKLVFVFSTNPREPWRKYKPPGHHWPANRLKWLKSAIKRVDFILANPEGTTV